MLNPLQGNRTGVGRKLRATLALAFLGLCTLFGQAPSNNPFPIRNGILQTNLNANNFQITNLDTSNLGLGGGGGGNDTGTTTSILKGDGDHGFANAAPGTDYLAPTGSGILLTGVVLTANNLSDLADAATGRLNLGLDQVNNTSDANKPVSTATTTALGLKADASAMTSALALKADAADLTSGLAAKEDTLPTSGSDGYILARDIDDTWHFVDPVTLGTTSQTFTDGVENTDTSYVSASANFVAGDVGKTITGDNIDPGTTIASRTNSTTIVLSQATTATGSGNTFTILNRLEVGGTGTVTSVSQSHTAPVNNLITISLTNPTTSPAFAFDIPTVAANTFYGNASPFTSIPGFMTAANTRLGLGLGSMALQANTGTSVAIQKGNGTGGFSPTVAGTDYLTPTGSGTGLTGILKTANNLSDVTAATARTNLGLSTVAATGAFFDLTAPNVGATTFYGNSTGTTGPAAFMTATAARTALSLAATASDIQKGNGSGGTTSAIANTDYARDNAQVGTNATATWANGVTNFIEGAALTATRTRTLPAASSYGDGTTIKYTDSITTANVGPLFLPGGTDTLKGQTSATWVAGANSGYAPFTGGGNAGKSKSITFQKRGTDWRVYSLGGETLFATGIQSSSNLNGVQVFDASALTNQHTITVADTNLAFAVPSDTGQTGFVKDIGGDGTPSKRDPIPGDVLPQVQTIAGAAASPTITNDGTIDTVRITGNAVGAIQLNWPAASNYRPGQTVILLDASGTISPTLPVTVVAANGTDTFNSQSSAVFDEAYGRRVFTSDGAGAWTVALNKTSNQPFRVIAPVGSTYTIVGDSGATSNKAHLNLGNGVNTLAINNLSDGMAFELVLVQPASGAAGTLSLPIGSRTSPGALGLVTLTATNGRVDRLRGSYDGTLGALLWDLPILDETSAALPTAPSALSATGINANRVNLGWTDNSSNETGFLVQRADGLSGTNWTDLSPTAAANATTYSDLTVLGAHDYNYRVKAFNTGGYSAASTAANVTTAGGGATADLLEWHFNDGGTSTSVAPTIGPAGTMSLASWTTSTQSGSGAAFSPVAGMAAMSGTAVAATCSGTCTNTYQYRVAAWKSSGTHNAFSPAVTTGATATAVLSPTNFNHITWTAVTGADYYEVYRISATGGTPSSLGRIATGLSQATTSFDDTGWPTNGTTPSNSSSTDATAVTASSNITYGQSISVSFWAKATYAVNGANIIANGSGTLWSIKSTSPNKFTVSFPRSTGTETGTVLNNVTSNGSAVNSGTTWHHIVVEMDNSGASQSGNEIKVYFDGNNPQTVSYTSTGSSAATFTPSAPVVAGGGLFTGNIDDVRIYNRILNTTEISDLFTGNAQ